MKSPFLVFILLVSINFFGCTKKCECIIDNPIEGTWHMSRVSGGLAGIDLTYNSGEVVWDFKENSSILLVTNTLDTNDVKFAYAKLATGQYSYATQSANGQNTLFVDGNAIGVYSIAQDKLLLDDGVAADGMLTEFKR